MFGIGIAELLVILFFLGPICVFIVFVFKAEQQLKKDSDTIIQEVKTIFNDLLQRQKSQETSQFTTSDHTSPPVALDESSRIVDRLSSKTHQGLYIFRHWHGALSLPISYWVNGFLLSVILVAMMNLFPWGDFVNKSPKLLSSAIIFLWISIAIVTIWQLVGIWRSASNYLRQGKSKVWGNLAKIAIVFGTISAVTQFVSAGIPQVIEYAKIATGNDPFGTYQLRVVRDATELEISGAIVFGLTDDVRRTLDAHPSVRIIHLNSEGGRTSALTKNNPFVLIWNDP